MHLEERRMRRGGEEGRRRGVMLVSELTDVTIVSADTSRIESISVIGVPEAFLQ